MGALGKSSEPAEEDLDDPAPIGSTLAMTGRLAASLVPNDQQDSNFDDQDPNYEPDEDDSEEESSSVSNSPPRHNSDETLGEGLGPDLDDTLGEGLGVSPLIH